MKQIITAKLKLITTPEQSVALRQTQLACSVERQVAATRHRAVDQAQKE
jgi:hypothetical protein